MSYDSEVAADSPLIYLKFDETSGTTAADSSGNSHPGTITGTPSLNQTPVMPNGTGSFQLNTTGKYVQVTNGSYMNVSAWTAEAWINLASTGSYHAVINRDGNAGARGWNLYVTGGKLNAFDSVSDHLGATTLSTGTAYHVAVTFDGTTIKLYLNGVLDNSFVTAFGVNSANLITVGTSNAGTPTPTNFSLDGKVDHVAYYGTALSAGRLLAHYAAGTAVSTTATGSITLSGTATPDVTSGTGSLTLSGSATAGARPSATGSLTLSGAATAEILYGTDTSNALNGLSLLLTAEVLVEQAIAPTPADTTLGVRVDKAFAFPVPTLVNGRPT